MILSSDSCMSVSWKNPSTVVSKLLVEESVPIVPYYCLKYVFLIPHVQEEKVGGAHSLQLTGVHRLVMRAI